MSNKSKNMAFVILGNPKFSPYINQYFSVGSELGYDIDLIYWDRYGYEEEFGDIRKYRYLKIVGDSDTLCKKMIAYIGFSRFSKKILKKRDYHKVIVSPTYMGILLAEILGRRYKHNFILDIRDFSNEDNWIYYKILEWVIDRSGMTVISSYAFEKFLPKHKYVISHNISIGEISAYAAKVGRDNHSRPIEIVFTGLIRFYEYSKKVLCAFANDPRFHLKYIGKNAEILQEFCEKKSINNVTFISKLEPQDVELHYKTAHIINNLYGNNDPALDYALSNKLYHAALFKIPIVVSPSTFMETIVKDYALGISFDPEGDVAQERETLYSYYEGINWDTFHENCEQFLRTMSKEQEVFYDAVKEFLSN